MRTPTTVLRLQAKFEDKDAAKGLVYAWWIPVFCLSGLLVSIAVTFVQRDQLKAVQIAAVLVLVLVPMAYMWFSDWWVPWWLDMISVFTAVAIILSSPADGVGAADAVSWALMFAVSKYAATERFRIAAFTAAVAASLMAVASVGGHLVGLPLHVTLVALGLVAGAMLYTQARALSAERAALAMEHTSATLAERDRIAREIHDLVAHSLSVTMLHITGARRVLADSTASEGDDVKEAIDALRDAERVGRQAMQDIRNTVSTLATDNDPRRPLPSADDLPTLVDRVRDAGLPASYDVHGDVKRLPPALGLGLYRVVQESLTNVTKHAPGSPVHVSLAVGRSDARLTVRSTRTVPHAAPDGSGSGITGMSARVSQLGGTLTAGPDGDAWVVESTLPIAQDDAHHCPVTRTISDLTEPKTKPEQATT
ncbi:MAG: histidine kinase [Aeromicrobium sp.]